MLLIGQMLYSIPSSNISVWKVFCAVSLCTYHVYIIFVVNYLFRIYVTCMFIFYNIVKAILCQLWP